MCGARVRAPCLTSKACRPGVVIGVSLYSVHGFLNCVSDGREMARCDLRAHPLAHNPSVCAHSLHPSRTCFVKITCACLPGSTSRDCMTAALEHRHTKAAAICVCSSEVR